jgi:hypothetical protein
MKTVFSLERSTQDILNDFKAGRISTCPNQYPDLKTFKKDCKEHPGIILISYTRSDEFIPLNYNDTVLLEGTYYKVVGKLYAFFGDCLTYHLIYN